MNLRSRIGSLLLALGALLVALTAAELAFYAIRSDPQPPGIFFHTEYRNVRLLSYDDSYNGRPDFDLRQDRPYGRLVNVGNTEDHRRFDHLRPADVPNATVIRTNELNLRGRQLATLEALQDTAAVTLVVGDSFCYGQGIPAADRFTELMEAELAAARPRQALVNACMGGMDASGILPMTRRLVRVIGRVERVIYAYNLNDALQGPRLQEMARQSRAIQALLNDPATSWSDSAVAPVADDLVFRMGLPLLRLWKSPTALWLLRRAAGGRLTEQTLDWYERMYADNTGWQQTREHLLAMAAYCRTREIEFVLVVFPVFFGLQDYPLLRVHEAISTFAAGGHIKSHDLLPLFAGGEAADYWVHPRDFHPNARAHREVADFLLTTLWPARSVGQ